MLALSIRMDLFIPCQPDSQHVSYVCASHAIAVMTAPAVAPAAPKQAIVESVGVAPFVFAIASGEVPKAEVIHAS